MTITVEYLRKLAEYAHKSRHLGSDYLSAVSPLNLISILDHIATLEASVAANQKYKDKHPIQPLYSAEFDIIRFKPNKIVQYLLDNGPFDMNHLACQEFDAEDEEQFAQLIGYSLSGFGDLDYVSDETFDRAVSMADTSTQEVG